MENESSYGPLSCCENRMPVKNLVLEKKGKSRQGSWGNRVQNGRLTIDLVHQISMNFSENVLDMKR